MAEASRVRVLSLNLVNQSPICPTLPLSRPPPACQFKKEVKHNIGG